MFERESAGPGDVQTVTGIRKSSDLGVLLPFEHLLSDVGATINPPVEANAREVFFSPIDEQVLSHVRYYGFANQDILRIGSVETMINELLLFRQWGGCTIVDCTSAPLGRDPVGLARLARGTGINIVMSTSHESTIALAGDNDDPVTTMVGEILEGDRSSGIRAGVIIYDESALLAAQCEDIATALGACVAVHKMTGAPLMVRPSRDQDGVRRTVDQLAELDVAPEHVIFGRVGGRSLEELSPVAQAGFLLSFDSFGGFGHRTNGGLSGRVYPVAATADNDEDPGLQEILQLISDGFDGQILLSHGIGRGDRLVRHGGHGYFYVLAAVIPSLRANGVSTETLDRLISTNPQKALTFCETR